jgi:uncharacterized phage-associated protein
MTTNLLNSLAVSNWFIEKSKEVGQEITIMKIQKLVYFAHCWCLALYDQPLVNERVDAWSWGPVFRDIHSNGILYGSDPVTNYLIFPFKDTPLVGTDDPRIPLLRRIWEVYGNCSDWQLSYLTTIEGEPWQLTWSKEPKRRNMNIDEDLIKTVFRAKL